MNVQEAIEEDQAEIANLKKEIESSLYKATSLRLTIDSLILRVSAQILHVPVSNLG